MEVAMRMKSGFLKFGALALLAVLTTPSWAGRIDGDAVVGGALGGAAGAAIGSAVGGRDGAIIGGGVGGAAGAALMANDRTQTRVVRQREVVYVDDHHDNGRHRGHYKNKHKNKNGRGGDYD
jgi:outer membrane lipoprotein SlyB